MENKVYQVQWCEVYDSNALLTFPRNPEHKGLLQWMKGEIWLWLEIMHYLIFLNLVSHLFPTQYSISLYSFNKHFNTCKLFLGVGKQWIRSSSKEVQNWAEIKMKKSQPGYDTQCLRETCWTRTEMSLQRFKRLYGSAVMLGDRWAQHG